MCVFRERVSVCMICVGGRIGRGFVYEGEKNHVDVWEKVQMFVCVCVCFKKGKLGVFAYIAKCEKCVCVCVCDILEIPDASCSLINMIMNV